MAKSKNRPQPPISPKKYVLTKARQLPIYKCFVNNNWEDSRLASIIVMRKHKNGNITAGFYLVDLLARGVKDTHFEFNQPEWVITEKLPEDTFAEMDYVLAHNIIYGAVAFAEDFDMKPHRDFSITQHILEEDTEDIRLIEIEFGVDGKPAFISGYEDDGGGESEDDNIMLK